MEKSLILANKNQNVLLCPLHPPLFGNAKNLIFFVLLFLMVALFVIGAPLFERRQGEVRLGCVRHGKVRIVRIEKVELDPKPESDVLSHAEVRPEFC